MTGDTPDHAAFYRGRDVMITGGLGFIGSNLARRLVGLGAPVPPVDSLIPACGGHLSNVSGFEVRDGFARTVANYREHLDRNLEDGR